MDCNNDDTTEKRDEPSPHTTDSETIESWTFLGDDSRKTTHRGTILGNENITDHHDDDTKSSSKTSRSSSSCVSENLLSVTNPGIDGDLSDGISVISDCDSINGRHSPMPTAKNRSLKLCDDDMDAMDSMRTSRVEEVDSYTLVERSTENEVEELSTNQDGQRHYVWNPSNIILFGLIIGAAAILSSQCWKINLSHEALMPEVSLLAQRIQNLESENLALKVEVSRLVDLHHAGHDHPHSNEKNFEQRPVKGKKVWTGADEAPIHIPKRQEKEYYCDDEHLNSDDLFSSYNVKKCKDRNSAKMEMDQRPTSKDDSGYDNLTYPTNESKPETKKKKNSNKDSNASYKREKFAESKVKNTDNQKVSSETDKNTRNEKFLKIQEEQQKIYDEANQKYLERQKKKGMKQDKKNLGDILKDQNNPRKQQKDTDSEWYDKMMKQREELRNSGSTKQQNKENWYIERANEREKVRGKHEKQSKSKQYR